MNKWMEVMLIVTNSFNAFECKSFRFMFNPGLIIVAIRSQPIKESVAAGDKPAIQLGDSKRSEIWRLTNGLPLLREFSIIIKSPFQTRKV